MRGEQEILHVEMCAGSALCVAMTVTQFIEYTGIAFGAMSGVLATRGRHIDLFGVLVLSLCTAFGGGTVRDVLIGYTPVTWLRFPEWIYTALGAALATFFLCGKRVPPRALLEVVDAFMLAFFTIAGTRKILDAGLAMPAALGLGVISGVSGGILRDVVMNHLPLVFQRQTYLYATAAFAGALFYCIAVRWLDSTLAMWCATALVLVLRLAAVKWKLALPEFPDE